MPFFIIVVMSLLLTLGCGSEKTTKEESSDKAPPLQLEPPVAELKGTAKSQFQNYILITGATILTGTGEKIENGHLIVRDGRIEKIGKGNHPLLKGAQFIRANGKYITPGLIDTHSHMGVYPNPWGDAHSDGNEATGKAKPEVWAQHSFWPQDPALPRALAGGITAIQVLPGSANLVGGRTFTMKMRRELSSREMRMDAPQGIKIACGENPKRVYGKKGGPSTRMGNVAEMRKILQSAVHYQQKKVKHGRDLAFWQKRVADAKGDEVKLGEIGDPPFFEQDAGQETLVKVLNGEILVHVHCYRADDIASILDLSEEFGFQVRSIHHGLEAYKLADRLKRMKVSTSTWVDWWGFKLEAFDGIPQNVAILHKAGAIAILHSDSDREIRWMNQEMAKAIQAGRKIGIDIPVEEAIKWITYNAAWALGIEKETGSLEVGKMADLVIWDRNPLSVYAKTSKVFVDGELAFDRAAKTVEQTDFELGIGGDEARDGRQFKVVSAPKLSDGKHQPIGKKLGNSSFVIENVSVWQNGKRSKPTVVQVEEGRITAVGERTKQTLRTIDGSGKILTIPFADLSETMGLTEIELEKFTVDARNRSSHLQGDFRVLDSFNPLNVRVAIQRSEGVGQMLLHPSASFVSGIAGWVPTDGQLNTRPRPNQRAAMLMSINGYSARHEGQSRSGLWMRFRQLVGHTERYMTSKTSYESNNVFPIPFDLATLDHFSAVLNGQMPLMVFVDRAADIKNLLFYVGQWRLKHKNLRVILVGAAESWLVAEELAAARIPVLMKPSVQDLNSFDGLHVRNDLAAYLAEKGVNVHIFSTAARSRQEAGISTAFGMDFLKALNAISSLPKLFGQPVPQVAVGQKASFVLWNGDPLQPLHYAEQMWLDGKEVSLNNRQLDLARRYRPQ